MPKEELGIPPPRLFEAGPSLPLGVPDRHATVYEPVNRGVRFSRNAVIPSLKSLD